MTNPDVAPNTTDLKSKISLNALAELTGFPVEMIKTEIFKGHMNEEEVSLDDLRAAMLTYIDSTMMLTEEK